MRERKITLSEREIPRRWFDFAADFKTSDEELKKTMGAIPRT